jgi:hypothetical protein
VIANIFPDMLRPKLCCVAGYRGRQLGGLASLDAT